jgi:hypothetical protein
MPKSLDQQCDVNKLCLDSFQYVYILQEKGIEFSSPYSKSFSAELETQYLIAAMTKISPHYTLRTASNEVKNTILWL